MSLSPGTRLGSYEVTAQIGVGGMGEVYQATDTNLARQVAIKVLPEAVAHDAERLARFDREAKLLAALNHPNIAQIHGLERSDGHVALVMELADGPTLADRIAQGPIPTDEALPIAKQIAEALEAAHEQGIIHRDLKPANIKVRDDGTVKVLDFGLAKAMEPAGAASGTASVSMSPTIARSAMTEIGVILGTAAYMSPEQARGKPVDKRADIWAFGCVLYEMLTGRRAFEGDDATTVLAKVIERDVDLDRLPVQTSPAVRALLGRCVTKDARRRLRDIGEARVAVEGVLSGSAGDEATLAPPSSRPRTARALPWAIAAGAVAVALYLVAWPPEPVRNDQPVSATVALPPGVELWGAPRLSADGAVLAFLGVQEGARRVFIRRLDSFAVDPLPGGADACAVALSPDASQAAFVTTDGTLVRSSLDGSVSQRLATGVDWLTGLAWSPDGHIVFGRHNQLWRVPAAGGEASALPSVDGGPSERLPRFPVVSSDARHVFYQGSSGPRGEEVGLHAVDLATGAHSLVIEDDWQAVWASPDRIVLARDGALFVVGIQDGRLTGTPERVVDGIGMSGVNGSGASISDTGSLLMAGPDVNLGRLVSVSTAGVETFVNAAPGVYMNARLSPDGKRVAYTGGDSYVWIWEIDRESASRIAPNGAFPVWIDSMRLVVSNTNRGLSTVRIDRPGTAEVMPGTIPTDYPASISPDGTTLAVVRIAQATDGDVYLFSLDGSSEPRPFLATPAYEGGAQFSPDGRWMAYQSDESGQAEVYITPYPSADRRFQVSSGGGLHPLWNADGRRIFYRSGERVLVVEVVLNDEPDLSPPRVLFDGPYTFAQNLSIPHYALGGDGQSLLMVKEEAGARSFALVTSWMQHLDTRQD